MVKMLFMELKDILAYYWCYKDAFLLGASFGIGMCYLQIFLAQRKKD